MSKNIKTYQMINYTKLCIIWGFQIPIPQKELLKVMTTNCVFVRLKKDGKTLYKKNGGEFETSISNIKAPFILIQGRY